VEWRGLGEESAGMKEGITTHCLKEQLPFIKVHKVLLLFQKKKKKILHPVAASLERTKVT
jgi:hypothetical protein